MYKIVVIFFAFCGIFPVTAQRVAAFFVSMPNEMLLQIETNRRKDMVDLFNHDRKEGITNSLGGKSAISAMTEDYMSVELSEVSRLDMRLLALNDTSTVIAVIRTVCAPVCDSRISFYDTGWNPLDIKDFIDLPGKKDFFLVEESSERDEAIALVDFLLTEYSFSSENNSLSVKNNIVNYLPEEVFKRISPYLKKNPLQYNWNGKRYESKD